MYASTCKTQQIQYELLEAKFDFYSLPPFHNALHISFVLNQTL